MKQAVSLYVGFLVIFMLGCQSPQSSSEVLKEEDSFRNDDSFLVSVNELSVIIATLCDELGITIDKTIEKRNRFEITGTSYSGRSIEIEAEELVKGTSFVQVTVYGATQVDKDLSYAIFYRIKPAICTVRSAKAS